MSALGLAAAAGCIGTGVVALTSDVLPYQGWAGGDHQRSDGSQLLPGARITQLASTHASPLNTGGFAPTLFVSAPVTRTNASTASAGSPALRSTKPGTVVVTRRSSGARRSTTTSRSQGSTGDARQHTADAPTAAAPAAPVTSAVAAVATPAPAASVTAPSRQSTSVPTKPAKPSTGRPNRHDDDHGNDHASGSTSGSGNNGNANQRQRQQRQGQRRPQQRLDSEAGSGAASEPR